MENTGEWKAGDAMVIGSSAAAKNLPVCVFLLLNAKVKSE